MTSTPKARRNSNSGARMLRRIPKSCGLDSKPRPSLSRGDAEARRRSTTATMRILGALLFVVGVLTAHAEAPATTPGLRRLSLGEVLYLQHCADCHGWEARGDGPLARILAAKPRDLRWDHSLFINNPDAAVALRILSGQALPIPIEPEALRYSKEEIDSLMIHLHRLPTLGGSEVATGRQVYHSLCAACHGLYGRGDGLGARHLSAPPADLRAVAGKASMKDTDLVRIITDGKGMMPGAGDVLTAHEIRAVVAFLRVLSPGYEVYDRFCARCHGAAGDPGQPSTQAGTTTKQKLPPRLDATYFKQHTRDSLRRASQHLPKQNRPAMPHFGNQLGSDQVMDIVRYLRTLPPE
jgi:mono/diheme cytochrome c family protein